LLVSLGVEVRFLSLREGSCEKLSFFVDSHLVGLGFEDWNEVVVGLVMTSISRFGIALCFDAVYMKCVGGGGWFMHHGTLLYIYSQTKPHD